MRSRSSEAQIIGFLKQRHAANRGPRPARKTLLYNALPSTLIEFSVAKPALSRRGSQEKRRRMLALDEFSAG